MFIPKRDERHAININDVHSIYTRKDVIEEDGKEVEKYAVVAEVYLKATEGSEAHYHAERIGTFDTYGEAVRAYEKLLGWLNG
jgi:hypothetical protein